MRITPVRLLYLLSAATLLYGCGGTRPPRTIRLPAAIAEASGLVIRNDRMIWHNDSGDGPYLYTTDLAGNLIGVDTLTAAARDYEDLTEDGAGRLYVGDFGNNTGRNAGSVVYRYTPTSGRVDTISFSYPTQDGAGRERPGNHDCEAFVWYRDSLHLFTKDQLFGRGRFYTYHFVVPDRPGTHVAHLVDSLYLPRRVVTAAAIDHREERLFLTAYNFKKILGFLPSSAASLITLTDYPKGRFLRGHLRRRNVSWAVPSQFEAVAVYNERYLYVATEGNPYRPRARARRLRIR